MTMKLFNMMNRYEVLRCQWAAIRRAALKKVVLAGMMVLSLSAGAVYGQSGTTVTITPNYATEILTLSCSDNTYTTFYWTTEENPQWQYDDEWEGTNTLSVSGLPAGTVISVCAMKMVNGDPVWSNTETLIIARYAAPEVTANYRDISNHLFTVSNSNSEVCTVRYAVGMVPDNTSSVVSASTVPVAQYYTTYNFRVFGDSKFPSENVARSTDRYDVPVIVDYVHYAAASDSGPETPVSGTIFGENGSYIYINYTHSVGGTTDTLEFPNPHDANSYDIVMQSASDGNAVPSVLTGDVFKMVVGPGDNTPVGQIHFPSPMVRVDRYYSGYFVISHNVTVDGATTTYFLSLDAQHQPQRTTTFDHSCLWMLDNGDRLYQSVGTDKYYLASHNDDLEVSTSPYGDEQWRIHTISHLLQDFNGKHLVFTNGEWRMVASSSPLASASDYFEAYMVNRRHAAGGTYDEITSFTLNPIACGGQHPEWMALANGDVACSLSVTPSVAVTTYELPEHVHFSYTDNSNINHDFTYYERNHTSYASHELLPYRNPRDPRTMPNSNEISYTWHLEFDEADGTGLTLGIESVDEAVHAVNTISRTGTVAVPQRARVWVEATYTITNTTSDGDVTTVSRTAANEPLVVYAEQTATGLTALSSDQTNQNPIFTSEHYYLIANYSEKDNGYGERHFLTGTDGNQVPYLSTSPDPERLFQITYNTGNGVYLLKNMTLNKDLLSTVTSSNYVNEAVYYDDVASSTSDREFSITPYRDGDNTYFTIRPRRVNDVTSASLVPQGGVGTDGAPLRMVDSKNSEHLQGTATSTFSENYYRSSRWQLVVPTLLPPTIEMDGSGVVTLTDVRPYITGILKYQVKNNGEDTWSTEAEYTAGTITLSEGMMLRAWKVGTADHAYLPQSPMAEFTAVKAATPAYAAAGNEITLSTATPEATLYYTISVGDDPEFSVYSGPFTMGHAGALRFYAEAPNMLRSDMGSQSHTAVLPLQIEADGTTATLGMADAEVIPNYYNIYYTVNGTDPTTGSTHYTGPISLDGVFVLKAKAFPSSEGNGYTESPIEYYYPDSKILSFSYIDNDRVAGHTPSDADTNVMLLDAGNGNQVKRDHNIDGTFLWRCAAGISTSTSSKLFNEETGLYLTFRIDNNDEIQVYGNEETGKEWYWGGEPTGSTDGATNRYWLYTMVGSTPYYLAFNTTNKQWLVTPNTTDPDLQLAVAYRTTTADYQGGDEFSANGEKLYIEQGNDNWVALQGDLPWLALGQGESVRLKAAITGSLLHYAANTDINIHKYGYDVGDETDPDIHVPWQQWHRQGDNYYHYYYDVYGYTAETDYEVTDGMNHTSIGWKYGETELTSTTSSAIDATYFTYQIDADHQNIITLTRTVTTTTAPVLNLMPITATYHQDAVYANDAVPFNSTISVAIYAESQVSLADAELGLYQRKRLVNKQTGRFLSVQPEQTVPVLEDYPYLEGEPQVGTSEQYTKYGVWRVLHVGSGNCYSLRNMVYQNDPIYRRPDNGGGLYLCNPESFAMFNYLHRDDHPSNPITGDNERYLYFHITKYADGENQYYVTITPYENEQLGLSADNSWQTVAYGNGGEQGYKSRRWAWERGWVSPPDISMNPSGEVTLTHRLQTDGDLMSQINNGILKFYYTTDGSTPHLDANNEPIGGTYEWVWSSTDPNVTNTTLTLTEGQTIKAIARLMSNLMVDGTTAYEAHTSQHHTAFTAVRTATPSMDDNRRLVATEGDSLVMGVNQELGSVQWNSEETEGIVRFNQSRVSRSEYADYFVDGDVMEVVAYRHNKLASLPYYYTQNQQLYLAVSSVTVGEVGADSTYSATITFQVTGSAQNGQNPQLSSYQIPYSYEDAEGASVAGSGTLTEGLTLTLTGLSGAVLLTANVEPRTEYESFYTASDQLNQYIVPAGYTHDMTSEGGVYLINNALDLVTVANNCNSTDTTTRAAYLSASYKVMEDIDLNGIALPSIGGVYSINENQTRIDAFEGRWDGNYKIVSHATNPLFTHCNNAYVYNVVIANSDITTASQYCGAICAAAFGTTRIYNCGVLGTSTVLGVSATGGIVGGMYDDSRVVNCYNYASVTSTSSTAGGIAGQHKTSSSTSSQRGIVFNCMNYGNVTAIGKKVSPVLGADKFTNNVGSNTATSGFNTYNYFRLGIEMNGIGEAYNRALAIQERDLTRFEYYRTVLNANLKKCGWWVGGTYGEDIANGATMGKWVLDKNIAPYPIVLPKYEGEGTARTAIVYPSVINPDYDNSDRRNTLQSYEGRKLGELNVTVNSGRPNDVVLSTSTSFPSISAQSMTLNITDMDTNAYDYTYYKVQLPYFQDVFGVGNNVQTVDGTDYIVTGWKITSVTGGTPGTFSTSGSDAYDFADRDCTNKDLYSESGRVFAQGGYYIVPNGVTGITIEAYWGKALYLAEATYDVSYTKEYVLNGVNFYGTPTYSLYGNTKTVYNTLNGIMAACTTHFSSTSTTVYDQAIVLLSDFHTVKRGNDNSVPHDFFVLSNHYIPFTITTVDEDNDHEPDHCLFMSYEQRKAVNPVRYDFIANLDPSIAGLPGEGTYRSTSIPLPNGHFEITETALAHYWQFEYDNRNESTATKHNAPLILNGGAFEQIVSTQKAVADRTQYIQMGGHVWFKMFSPGVHGDGNYRTHHCPVTVTGGEYKEFYLSGMFNASAYVNADSPHLYACGGKFGMYASGGQEKINGDVVVKADHIIADEFYGGGVNPAKPIMGHIDITLNNSIVQLYSGGPKFGNMQSGKYVRTTANGTIFGTYYGAGYGGTGLSKRRIKNVMDNVTSTTDLTKWINDDSTSTLPWEYGVYVAGHGQMTDYEFEFMPRSGGMGTHVRRFYIYRASLSKAATNNVTSTLTNCTVTNDYYGAGYVGRVNGTATTTLDNCIIKGNVYAGGNSSAVPKANLYQMVDKMPEYIYKTGIYVLPDKPEPDKYTWTYKSGYYENGSLQIDIENKLIYTNVSFDDMGQADATQLTITGNTVVEGSVFGGGNLAEVAGNTTLTIGEETLAAGEDIADHRPYIHGNVYGGGNVADVGTSASVTNTTVNVYEGYMRSVYGGGNQGSIGGNTVVNLLGGFVGYRPVESVVEQTEEPGVVSEPEPTEEPVVETVPEAIRPTIGRDKMFFGVYGGGFGIGTTVTGTATVNIGHAIAMTDDIKVFGSVYGGGEAGQVGGGYHKVTLNEGETLTANHYYFDFDNERYVRCVAGTDQVEGRDYYTFNAPSFATPATNVNSGTRVTVKSNGTKTTEIDGAVFGGGRGYYLALENDTVVMGSEVDFRRPMAGAVYGNTYVEIGTHEQDTSKLKIGSLRFFTKFDDAREYGLINQGEITSSPMGYWRQDLYVYDMDVLRYVPLTTGENVAEGCNALTKAGGRKLINTSAAGLDDEVQYFMNTGRVSVAGGGEMGRVLGSTAFDNSNILFGNQGEALYGATGGCTEVVIHSGTMGDVDDIDTLVSGDVYGAGLKADIDGTSSVTIDGTSATAWIRGDVYAGGCMGTNHAYNRESENVDIIVTRATVTGGWLRNLHAASNLVELPKNGNSQLVFGTLGGNDDDLLVSESVYGGSGLSYMLGSTDVTVNSGHVGYIRVGYPINSVNEDLQHTEEPQGTIIANIDSVLSYEGNVYGGGYGPNAYVKNTKVTVNGGKIRNGVFGGGELAPVGEIVTESGDGISVYEYKSYAGDASTYYRTPTVVGSTNTMGFVTDVIIKGGTMSGVYGGGRGYSNFLNVASTMPGTIMGSASVYIGGGTIDTMNYSTSLGGGNVYGGGLEGEVTGDTRVTIAGGTIKGRVFAGGRGYRGTMLDRENYGNVNDRASRRAGWVLGNTALTVKDSTENVSPTVAYGVYGGGEGLVYKTDGFTDVVAVVDGNATVNIEGGTIGGGHMKGNDPYRGSYAGGRVAQVNGYADMLVSGTADVASVYGGNDISGKIECANDNGRITRSTTNTAENTLTNDSTETYVRITGSPLVGHVYGGGNGQYPYYTDVAYSYLNINKPIQMKTYVDVKTDDGNVGQVFGGGNSATVGMQNEFGVAQVFYRGTGHVDTVFAGGNSATVTGAATVTVQADVASVTTATPEHIGFLFGGNNMAEMKILPTLNLSKGVFGKVYGGGNAGAMTGKGVRTDVFEDAVPSLSTYVLVNSDKVTIRGALFGGCNNAVVSNGTYVDVRNTSTEGIKMLFGGNDISEEVSSSRVDISGGLVSKMFGGGNGYYDYRRNGNRWDVYDKAETSAATGDNNVTPSEAPVGTDDTPSLLARNTVGAPVTDATLVNIWGGTVDNSIYGGGYAGDCGNTHVVVNDMYRYDENASQDPIGRTNGGTASINGKIFGGGYGDLSLLGTETPHVGNVTGCATTDLQHVQNLRDAYAYGGGEAGDVHDAVITVYEDWNQPLTALYGGCYGSDVTGTATVNLRCSEVEGYNIETVYGGNDYTGTVNRSVVNVHDGKYERMFGAGNGQYQYTTPIAPPNSKYPTVNFYNGTLTGNLYGGGDRGMCFVGDTTQQYSNAEDYAHVVVNIHGGSFGKDIFAGAAGDEISREQLVYGLKQLNMDGGNVANSVYGGSESVDDGYPECVSSGNTTQRPSTIMNIVGGRIHNHMYGGGYLGKVNGSVYVNVGKEAVEDSPVWTNTYNGTNNAYNDFKPSFVTVDEDNVESNLKPHDLYMEASIYAGANWGDATTGSPDFTTPGFIGGESRIFIDGAGYNTTLETTTTTDDPIMNIYYSLIGAGTSCEGGDVLRHIMVRNYGKYDNCTPSRELFSIQRADSVWLQDVALRLLGDQDASSAYPSTRYSINRVGHLIMKGYNMLEVTTPMARVGELEFLTDGGVALQPGNTDALAAMRNGLTTDCSASNCQKLGDAINPINRRYSALLVTNGVPIDIVGEDGAWGAVKGYGFLLTEDGTQAIVSARRKTAGENSTDGGFFSGCSTENSYTSDGAYAAGELTFTNETSGTTRAWKLGHGVRSRQLTILAHANVGNLPDINKIFDNGDNETNYPLALAKGTLELPATVPGHYYVITGGVQVDQANGEMRLTDCAFNPNDFSTMVASNPVDGNWITVNGATTPTQTEVEALIRQNANSTFGLLMTAGDNFGTDYSTATPISANQYFSQLGSSYRTASVAGSDATAEVRPTLDFYLTYCTNFATTIFGDVTFDLVEMDEDGDAVGDTIRVTVSVSTLIDMFRDQSYELVAVHNDNGNNTYSRKLVLPSTLQRRELYLTQIEWAPMDNSMRPSYASDVADGSTANFKLTTWGTTSASLENDKFTLKMDPTEQLSASLTTTLGWARIEQNDIDVFTTAGGTTPSSTLTHSFGGFDGTEGAVNTPDNLGFFMGVLDGRSSAAIDLTMGFNGAATYTSGYKGRVILTFEYYNSGSYQERQAFQVTLYIRTREHGDTIYVASNTSIERGGRTIGYSQSISDNQRGKRPSVYLDKFQRAFDENIYQPGDVFCVLDEVRISDNLVIHGSDYNVIPVVRYEGHHSDFPGRACAYLGPMISIIDHGRLSVDNMIFDGSKYSSYIVDPASDLTTKAMGTMSAYSPIFNVTDHGQLILGNGTYVQNNSNRFAGGTNESGMWGGAIRVEGSGAKLLLNNSVIIQDNLVADGVASGAVHLNGGEMKLGVANSGTAVQIVDNYHLPENTSPETVSTEWDKANVYLTRLPSGDNNPLVDGISDIITFENAIAPDTRIGISKEFPGETIRDTIMVARMMGSQVQYAGQAYENNNFFDDNTGRNVFYHATISPNTLYFQRCATFQKQVYGQELVYNYRSNNELVTLTNGTQLPVMTYLWNRYAACPDETDSMIYSVHGGFYPYQYEWSWSNTSADNLDVFRTYNTQTQSRPYSNVAVSAGLAEGNYVPATSSNSDTAALYGTKGNQGTFHYRVTATDLAGCEQTTNFQVTLMQSNVEGAAYGVTLTNPINDEELKYSWNDVSDNTLEAQHIYKGIHLIANVNPTGWGSVVGNIDGDAGATVSLTEGRATQLCPGDAIRLNAIASDSYNFIQWDFDPYDQPSTVFVMPHSSEDIRVNAYFGPNDYWKDVVTSEPLTFEYDYNGDVHIYDEAGLAWLISLTNGLNGAQIRDFYFNTVHIHGASGDNGNGDAKDESTATAKDYNMSAHLWTPMGTAQHRFMGKLEVDEGVTISGIIVNEPRMSHVGFFAYLDSANIDGLHIQNSLFHGSQFVGGIAAEAVNSTIQNSVVGSEYTAATTSDGNTETGDNTNNGKDGEGQTTSSGNDVTTIITANYTSGGLVGNATNCTIESCEANAIYMGATIYNGGILGYGQEVSDVTNSSTFIMQRMSSLYSGGIIGSVSGPDLSTKSGNGSRISNNYVYFAPNYATLNRMGGLVGYARNTTLENNYVYGSTKCGILTGALGAVLDGGVTVGNCYYEQGSNETAFGYSGTGNHTVGVTTFNGVGNQVRMADRVDGSNNLTLALNRWVRDHADEGYATWRSDMEGINHGYPRFGKPDIVPVYENISYETCDSFIVAGQTLTESGVYEFHVVDSADFVDSTILLTLMLNYSSVTQFEDTVMQGEDYEAYGFHLSATEIDLLRDAAQQGEMVTVVVSDTLQSMHGCDSIVTLYLTVGKRGTDEPPVVLDVKVYPNPTVGRITVEADDMQTIELYDGVSRRIDYRTVEGGISTLDLSGLPSGMYYMRVKTANGTVIKKIVKQ